MIKAYINYPNPHITVHSDAECLRIQQQHKQNQRFIRIDVITMSEEVKRFETKHYQFGAHREINDMWCEIDLGDPKREQQIIEDIRRLLAVHYSPFKRVEIEKHICKR